MQAAGFVLVGGLSTRMGQDKALLSSGPHPLVTHIARQVSDAVGNVVLVGKPERYRDLEFPCLIDLRPDLGPLAGIEAALESRRADTNLIVACDMPGLHVSHLRALIRHAEETQSSCVVTRDGARAIHPLCAVYRSSCLPVVRRAIDRGRLKLMDVIEELGATCFDTNGMIWNVNTPQEWTDWRQQQLSSEGAPFALPNGN